MSRRCRLIAFAVACLAVAGVAVLLANRGDRPQPAPKRPAGGAKTSPRPTSPAPRPEVSGPPAVVTEDRRARRKLRAEAQAPLARLREEQPRVDAAARGFMRGFLAIDVGDRGPEARRALAEHAEPQLARFLLADRPRLPPGTDAPPRGEVLALEGEFDKPPSAYRARVVVDHGGEPTELGLELRKRGRGWTVVEVTE